LYFLSTSIYKTEMPVGVVVCFAGSGSDSKNVIGQNFMQNMNYLFDGTFKFRAITATASAFMISNTLSPKPDK